MEPILTDSQIPDEQPLTPIDTTKDSILTSTPNNHIKIGLYIFLGIVVFLVVVLGYAAYNYQGTPKETSNKDTISISSNEITKIDTTTISDSNAGNEMITTTPEDGIEIPSATGEPLSGMASPMETGALDSSMSPENQEALPPSIAQENPEISTKEEVIIPSNCADGSCNNGCGPTEYWNGIQCMEAGKYKTHATQCVTNTAKNLPAGYFVAHYLWDSGDCAGNDYNIGDYSNMEGIRTTDKCQSGKMICKKEYSDSCVLGAGICTCYDL